MPMSAEEITRRIKAALPDAVIELKDLAGDDDHWQVTVVSPGFQGLSRIEQHKRVMAALGGAMGTTLHALGIRTRVS